MIEMTTNMILFFVGVVIYIGGVTYCVHCLRGGKCCKKQQDDEYNLINEGTDLATIDV